MRFIRILHIIILFVKPTLCENSLNVRFKPRVVQFFDDDISDFNGNWSGLAQDIAREVFGAEMRGVHFCTAAVNATGVDGKVV